MNYNNNKSKEALRPAALACACALFAGPATAEIQFEPRLGLAGIWLDNADLAGPGQPHEEQYVAQLTPGLHLVQEGQRVNTYLDYEAQALFFEDSDRDEVFHTGDLGIDIEALPDWLFVKLAGVYQQNIIDPLEPQNIDNLFEVGNVVDSAAARVTPALIHDFGTVQVSADYTRGFVDYHGGESEGEPAQLAQDSDNDDANASIGSSDPDAPLSWEARYHYEHVEYEVAVPFEYERADAEIGARLTRKWRLIVRAGAETDPFAASLAQGGLDESFWEAGFGWRRDNRNEFRALTGERFFGTSYEVLLRLSGRILGVEMGYDEKPTTETQRLALAEVPSVTDPTPVPEPIFGRVGTETYLLKRLYADVTLTGRFTEVVFDVASEDREYVQLAGIKDHFRSAQVLIRRDFGSRTSGEIEGSVVKGELREGDDYDERSYRISLIRTLGPHTVLALSGTHLERSSSTGVREYDANMISLGVQLTF